MSSDAARLHDEIVLMSGFASFAQLHSSRTEKRLHALENVKNSLVFGPYHPDPCSPATHITRTARILDSLAQVAVSDKEVVAIAVAYPGPKEILIKIAANDGISNKTKTYMEELLKLLQKLSKTHRPLINYDSNADSPQKDSSKESEEVQKAQDEIYTLIFSHFLPKLRRRFDKAKLYLEDIRRAAETDLAISPFKSLMNLLDNASLVIESFEKLDVEAQFNTNEVFRGFFITALLRILTASTYLTSAGKPPPPVVRFMEGTAYKGGLVLGARNGQTPPSRSRSHVIHKICVLPRSAFSLVQWAMSPRSRNSFDKEVRLEFLDKTTTGFLSPTLRRDAKDALLDLLGYQPKGLLSSEIDKSLPFLRQHLNPKRHAECTIVLHTTTRDGKKSLFCNYIGVSKLSCFGCTSFISHFNNIYETDWVTSGSHHKIYPWGILQQPTDPGSTSISILKEVRADFRRVLRERCEARFGREAKPSFALSDSSVSSGEGRPTDLIDPMEDFEKFLETLS